MSDVAYVKRSQWPLTQHARGHRIRGRVQVVLYLDPPVFDRLKTRAVSRGASIRSEAEQAMLLGFERQDAEMQCPSQ